MLRACLSISNNIAEGYERSSKKDESKFLIYAKGSCGEVRSMVLIAEQLGFISQEVSKDYVVSLKKISAGLHKMVKKNRIED